MFNKCSVWVQSVEWFYILLIMAVMLLLSLSSLILVVVVVLCLMESCVLRWRSTDHTPLSNSLMEAHEESPPTPRHGNGYMGLKHCMKCPDATSWGFEGLTTHVCLYYCLFINVGLLRPHTIQDFLFAGTPLVLVRHGGVLLDCSSSVVIALSSPGWSGTTWP